MKEQIDSALHFSSTIDMLLYERIWGKDVSAAGYDHQYQSRSRCCVLKTLGGH
jgi:hypothetical protein